MAELIHVFSGSAEGAWLMMDKSAHNLYLSRLASGGFVVASVEYRTSNQGPYPMPLQDVKATIRYLKAHADRFRINKEQMGVMGESAGGYLTCMVALDHDPALDVGEYLEESSEVQAALPLVSAHRSFRVSVRIRRTMCFFRGVPPSGL